MYSGCSLCKYGVFFEKYYISLFFLFQLACPVLCHWKYIVQSLVWIWNSGEITSINVFSTLHNTLCLCKITSQVYNNTIPAVETDPKEIYLALILHLEFVLHTLQGWL